jgi:hypothetical protein
MTLILDELATLSVLEARLSTLLATVPASTRLATLRHQHGQLLARLHDLLRTYERFTQPGHRSL